jgi:hypothetical protein
VLADPTATDDGTNCIFNSWICDGGTPDCSNGADEADCNRGISSRDLVAKEDKESFIDNQANAEVDLQMVFDAMESGDIKKYKKLHKDYMMQSAISHDGSGINIQDFEETRVPIGWQVITSSFDNPGWFYGFTYEELAEIKIKTLTNSGWGDWSEVVSGTTPALPVPANLTVTAGPQDPTNLDSYEFVNLTWEYPTFDAVPYPYCDGQLGWIGDGYCDSINNNDTCGYDGGDCCQGTCDSTLETYDYCDECTDCGTQSDSGWSQCYDPAQGGSGVPTCNDDYQFGAVVSDCFNFTNALESS